MADVEVEISDTDAESGPSVRCPACDEEVGVRWALVRPGDVTTLICWSGHRFGLDGQLL